LSSEKYLFFLSFPTKVLKASRKAVRGDFGNKIFSTQRPQYNQTKVRQLKNIKKNRTKVRDTKDAESN